MLEGVVWMDGGQFQVVVVASIPALFISWPASQANPLWVVLGQGGQRPLPFISIFNYRSVRSPSGVGPSGWRSLHHPRWSPWAESLKGGRLLLGIAIYSECLLAERHPICTPLKASDSKASFIVVVGQPKPCLWYCRNLIFKPWSTYSTAALADRKKAIHEVQTPASDVARAPSRRRHQRRPVLWALINL